MFKIRSMKLIVRCSNGEGGGGRGEGANLSQGNLISSAELIMYTLATVVSF